MAQLPSHHCAPLALRQQSRADDKTNTTMLATQLQSTWTPVAGFTDRKAKEQTRRSARAVIPEHGKREKNEAWIWSVQRGDAGIPRVRSAVRGDGRAAQYAAIARRRALGASRPGQAEAQH